MAIGKIKLDVWGKVFPHSLYSSGATNSYTTIVFISQSQILAVTKGSCILNDHKYFSLDKILLAVSKGGMQI